MPIWSIGIIPRALNTLLTIPPTAEEIRTLTNTNGKHLSDPFGLYLEGRLHVIAEQVTWARRTWRGELVAFTVSNDNDLITPKRLRIADHHFSYPFIFRWRGDIWMIPETHVKDSVKLYVAESFPLKWRFHSVLLEGVAGIDMTIFERDSRWWMLGTGLSVRWPGSASNLYCWYADSPLGPWQPHAQKPVRTANRLVRPAGTVFTNKGVLYRPAQNSIAYYGNKIGLYEITTLTPTTYSESLVTTIEPIAGTVFSRGVHHLAAVTNEITLFDGVVAA